MPVFPNQSPLIHMFPKPAENQRLGEKGITVSDEWWENREPALVVEQKASRLEPIAGQGPRYNVSFALSRGPGGSEFIGKSPETLVVTDNSNGILDIPEYIRVGFITADVKLGNETVRLMDSCPSSIWNKGSWQRVGSGLTRYALIMRNFYDFVKTLNPPINLLGDHRALIMVNDYPKLQILQNEHIGPSQLHIREDGTIVEACFIKDDRNRTQITVEKEFFTWEGRWVDSSAEYLIRERS